MATNPYVNKVVYGNQTVMDITDTTAEPENVLEGEVFYDRSGTRQTGSAVIPDISNCYQTTDTAETDIQDADYFPFYDTSATAKRNTLWSNIKAKIKLLVNPVRITLTKAQYDALSSSEKSDPDKVYYVTDYDAPKTYVELDDSSITLDKVWSGQKIKNYADNAYTLPTASASVKGGIKVNDTAANGVYMSGVNNEYLNLRNASKTQKGGIYVGNGLSVSSGTLSIKIDSAAENIKTYNSSETINANSAKNIRLMSETANTNFAKRLANGLVTYVSLDSFMTNLIFIPNEYYVDSNGFAVVDVWAINPSNSAKTVSLSNNFTVLYYYLMS